jgi:type II restriction/modification system DNA methylase subunit YeeA
MDRTAVKKFAIEARRILLQQVAAQTERLGITIDRITEPQTVSGGLIVAGITLDTIESYQYQQLREKLNDLKSQEKTLKGAVTALIDEVAYTWFNRLAALRFMEVNGYLKRRVLSSSDPKLVDPDLLRDASDIAELEDLPGLNRSIWLEWRGLADKAPNPEEFLYRRLLGLQCQELAVGLPFLFAESYPALLMPGNLLNQDSIVRKLVADIAEVDWLDTPDSENGVEIVGWLYQFYISERKDAVIGAKSKVAARDIPAATQLFTPHWIVRYMVENSLGRLWLEAHPESQLRAKMPYYLESAPLAAGMPEVAVTLPTAALPQRPEELTVIDPACGSGHILVYAFDLLFEIYKEQGYLERDIPALILTHNLHGLDIDDRAVQLASFAVLMKARAKNPRILRKPPQLKILTVRSTRHLSISHFTIDRPQVQAAPIIDYQLTLDSIVGSPRQLPLIQPPSPTLPPAYPLLEQLLATFAEADNLGSLITPDGLDAVKLSAQLDEIAADMPVFASEVSTLREIVRQAELLSQKYWVVVANPPYMGSKGMNSTLKDFAEKNYPASKSDLFAVSVERIMDFALKGGFIGLMTPFTWMFLSSYEKLRKRIINENTLTSLIRPEYHAFFDSAFVPICTFTLSTHALPEYRGTFVDLKDFYGAELQPVKVLEAIANPDCGYLYYAKAADFAKIPGSPIAYWASNKVVETFYKNQSLFGSSNTYSQNVTGNNDRFLRLFWEINIKDLGESRWKPYAKGGGFRRWEGNIDSLINWTNEAKHVYQTGHASQMVNEESLGKLGITWGLITSGGASFRLLPEYATYDKGGSSIFLADADTTHSTLSFLNSCITNHLLISLNPTLNCQVENIRNLPIIANSFTTTTQSRGKKALDISREDWDNFETSWDFQTHPLLRHNTPSLAQAFTNWHQQSETAFAELKRLEEENNRYWIEAYGLQAELSPEVPDEQITIRRADLARDIRSLISYAVGCMMGRYSLDTPGLIHAGQPFDPSRHHTFPAADDGILPITDPAYFDDDIVSRFVEFLKVAYSPDTLTENLDFIATALELKPGQTARERIRRYFLTEFISDHIKIYKKRPIYWLFTSGKASSRRGAAFGALVYLHRYTPATVARLRTDYVLELQLKLDQEIQQSQQQQDTSTTTAAKKAAAKQLKTRQDQQTELRDYQAKLQTVADSRIELDLDDGVAYNYTRFKGLVYEGSDLKMADLEAKAQWKIELLERDRKLVFES